MAWIHRISPGSLLFHFGNRLFSTALEVEQAMVPLGVFPWNCACGERRFYVRNAVYFGCLSAVYCTGSLVEQASDELVAMGGACDICCNTFGFGLAIRQFQLGWVSMNSPKDLMAGWNCVAGWVMRYRFATACFIVVLTWLPFLASLHAGMQGDVAVYKSDAYDLMQGRMPYRDVLLEYPPLCHSRLSAASGHWIP